MGARRKLSTDLYVVNGGNGSSKGVSTACDEIVQFETVMAPLTGKKGLKVEDEMPTYSLKIDGQTYVFGQDVFGHGRRNSIVRLNDMKRYNDPSWFYMIYVLWLHLFAQYRGTGQMIEPTGVVSIPVSEFNKTEVKEEILKTLVKEHTLVDHAGCELRININPKKFQITPESTGDLFHWAFDPEKLKGRPNVNSNGTVLLIDIGYETTDCSVFEGMKYQRDLAMTIPRAGMGVIARSIQESLRSVVRDADITRIDMGMRKLAGKPPKAKKEIEVNPGVKVDITPWYDQEVDYLAQTIAGAVRTFYNIEPSTVLISGGGAYHMLNHMKSYLAFKETPEAIPDSEWAGIVGTLTMLLMKAQKVS